MMRNRTIARFQWVGLAAVTGFVLLAGAGVAQARGVHYCSYTAWLQFAACGNEAQDDLLTAKAICLNVSDHEDRIECFGDSRSDLRDAREECAEQREARVELCGEIGEGRYDPSFDPEDFETTFTNKNSWFPLAPGNQWVYENEDEKVTVEVEDATKLIDGVTCIVVNDVVDEDGKLVEDTDDWFGQRKDGTIDYCGEEAKDFEYTDGDVPSLPELVEIEGSFKAGRDGDKSGTLFMGTPVVGAKYRQEWSPSNAEDVAEVLSTTYGHGGDARFDPFVPEDLAELLCDDDCVVTADTSPLDPGVLEYKFYARGVGFFFEVKPESGEALQIVECNVDPKCEELPEL
jgi:hypothetical protein